MANTKITTNVIADDAVTSDKLGGDLTMPGHVSLADNKELRIGTGNDLVIKHDGSHTTLTNTTGNFTLLGDAVYIGNAANNEYLAQFIANGAASLRYDDTEQLATVSGGVYVPNKLGIGTNSPTSSLHVFNNESGGTSTLRLRNQHTDKITRIQLEDSQGSVGDALIAYVHSDASSANHYLGMGVNNQTTLTINNDDKVGIGTTSPARKLEINTGGYNQLMIASNASADTNKLAGIESRNYSNYALGLLQMFANSSQTGLYHGSADSSAKGVTDHYFMTSPSKDSATNNTVMKLTSARNVEITDGNLSFASGHGIDFGATSNAPNLAGLGTETFNDYEDGTWTPVLIAGTTNPTGGGALAPSGRYTKIGNRVWVTFYVGRSWTNTPAGGIYVSGLPYTINASTNGYYSASVVGYNIDGSDSLFLLPNVNSTTLQVYRSANNSSWGVANWTTHTNGTIIYVTGTFSYHV